MRLRSEIDEDLAQRRLSEAATEAKALEDAGGGFEANVAWERYQLIDNALRAQRRRQRVAAGISANDGDAP